MTVPVQILKLNVANEKVQEVGCLTLGILACGNDAKSPHTVGLFGHYSRSLLPLVWSLLTLVWFLLTL